MKNSLIIILISSFSLGSLLLTKPQPSAEAKDSNLEYKNTINTDSLQCILDSITDNKKIEVNKYVTEIEKSNTVIENQQKKLEQVSMQVDLLSLQVDTMDINTLSLKNN